MRTAVSRMPQSNAPDTPEVTSVDTSFADILNEFEQSHHTRGETLEGTVVSVTPDAVFVDVGRKTDGVLPNNPAMPLKPGQKLVVSIRGRDEEGNYLLSTVRVETPRDWSGLEAAFANKSVIAGRVLEVIKGGLRVDVGVRAFMPASRSGAREERERQSKQEAFVKLQAGDVVRGEVRTVTDFGAFVDLGGLDGLLHVSDMTYSRGVKPSEVVSPGQTLDVKILKINRDTRKISLGFKQLAPDPWTVAAEKYQQGARLTGKVSRVADFGAFVELEPGIEGLIHVSEMSW